MGSGSCLGDEPAGGVDGEAAGGERFEEVALGGGEGRQPAVVFCGKRGRGGRAHPVEDELFAGVRLGVLERPGAVAALVELVEGGLQDLHDLGDVLFGVRDLELDVGEVENVDLRVPVLSEVLVEPAVEPLRDRRGQVVEKAGVEPFKARLAEDGEQLLVPGDRQVRAPGVGVLDKLVVVEDVEAGLRERPRVGVPERVGGDVDAGELVEGPLDALVGAAVGAPAHELEQLVGDRRDGAGLEVVAGGLVEERDEQLLGGVLREAELVGPGDGLVELPRAALVVFALPLGLERLARPGPAQRGERQLDEVELVASVGVGRAGGGGVGKERSLVGGIGPGESERQGTADRRLESNLRSTRPLPQEGSRVIRVIRV